MSASEAWSNSVTMSVPVDLVEIDRSPPRDLVDEGGGLGGDRGGEGPAQLGRVGGGHGPTLRGSL
jgi:hypothetical protein